MPFVTPLALLGLLFVPLVLAMYLLKLRRDQTVVPSTLLWHRLVADVEANAPWQRLRRSLLLLLQLLLVAILAFLAARPFLERPAGLARDLVLVVDASASMAATDVEPSRLDVAKQAAGDALRDLPSGGRVSVIAAGRSARVVANGTDDLARVRAAIDSIEATPASGDLGDALRLASALAARSGDAEVLVVTDAALAEPPDVRVEAPVRVIQVGRDAKNQAIAALAVRTAPSSVTRSVFASIVNTDLDAATRTLEVWADGALLEARQVVMDAQSRTDVVIDDVPPATSVVEVRLTGSSETAGAGPSDHLALDDRAWAVVPPDRQRDILLVSTGDPYLETALSYLPNTRLFAVEPDRYPQDAVRTDGTDWDLIIFEATLPEELPTVPTLAIAPPESSPLGTVTGRMVEPGIGSLDPSEPILRYVDLSSIHIAEARRLELPEWARTIIPGPRGAPLLYAGDRAGVPTAVLAFEPRRSDLPLQVAFPILLANVAGELMGGSDAPQEAILPGSPVTLRLPSGATALRVERPDGTVDELTPGTPGAVSVVFSRTELLGVYTVTAVMATPSPTTPGSPGSPSPSSPSPPASPGASPGSDPIDASTPIRFAVDLFDVDESSIAPRSGAAIEDLGTDRDGGAAAPDRPAARDEMWVPILLVVLALLLVEWMVYERDSIARIRRALAARLGRSAPAGSPGTGARR
jgi:hypothetical protein